MLEFLTTETVTKTKRWRLLVVETTECGPAGGARSAAEGDLRALGWIPRVEHEAECERLRAALSPFAPTLEREARMRDEQAVIDEAKAWAAPGGNGAASHTPEARRLCAAVDRLTGEDGAGR